MENFGGINNGMEMEMENGEISPFSVKNAIVLVVAVIVCIYMYISYNRTNDATDEETKKREIDRKMKIAREKRLQQLEEEMEKNKVEMLQQKKRELEKEKEKEKESVVKRSERPSSTFDHFRDNTRYYRPSVRNRYAKKS